jgi:hypothetical protein
MAAMLIEGGAGLIVTLSELPLMDLAARATPRGSEGLGFASPSSPASSCAATAKSPPRSRLSSSLSLEGEGRGCRVTVESLEPSVCLGPPTLAPTVGRGKILGDDSRARPGSAEGTLR